MSAALLRILLLLFFFKRNCSVFQGLTLPFICADHYRILSYPSVIFYTGLWYCQRAAVNVREMSISRREKQHHRRSKAVLAPRAVNSVPTAEHVVKASEAISCFRYLAVPLPVVSESHPRQAGGRFSETAPPLARRLLMIP